MNRVLSIERELMQSRIMWMYGYGEEGYIYEGPYIS
jgi:hypothetical protein